MAHHQPSLQDIGREGFEIIEQNSLKKAGKAQKARAPQHPHQPIMHRRPPQPTSHYFYPHEPLVYQVTRVSSKEETTVLHDGAVFMDFTRRRPTRLAY